MIKFWDKAFLLLLTLSINQSSALLVGLFGKPRHATNHVKTPGSLRRRLFGEMLESKVRLPPAAVDGILRATECNTLWEGLKTFRSTLRDQTLRDQPRIKAENKQKEKELPTPAFKIKQHKYFDDALHAQDLARREPLQPFLKELTPKECGLEATDSEAQLLYISRNAEAMQQMQLEYGCIYFRGWSIFSDSKSLDLASKSLGMVQCDDPANVLGSRQPLGTASAVFEASNHESDAQTHIGMHTECIPGYRPSSGLFACFKAAESGGEFLLSDGQRVLRDIDSEALARLESYQMTAVVCDFPRWVSLPPGPLKHIPPFRWLQAEIVSLFVDLVKPDRDYAVVKLPRRINTALSLVCVGLGRTTAAHPVTGVPTWIANLDAGHKGLFAERNPHLKRRTGRFSTTTFDVPCGDGSSVPMKDIRKAEEAMVQNTVPLAMKPGDAVWLDNFRTFHGRKPFVGERQHAVVWGK